MATENNEDLTIEQDERDISSLVKEDKRWVEFFKFDDEKTFRNVVMRLYEQRNGKYTVLLSIKSNTPGHKEDIVYRASDLDDEKHADALLAIDSHVYTRYGNGHGLSYKLLSFYDKPWVRACLCILVGIIIAKLYSQ